MRAPHAPPRVAAAAIATLCALVVPLTVRAADATASPQATAAATSATTAVVPAVQATAAAGASVVTAPSGVSFVNPTAQLTYGQTAGHAQLLLKIDGLNATAMHGNIIGPVTDLGTSMPAAQTHVEPGAAVEIQPQGKTTRFFSVDLNVKNLPLGSSQKRYLRFALTGADGGLEYTLTNAATGQFTWSVKAPATVAVSPHEPLPITIWTGPVPANGVKVSQTALVENVSRHSIEPDGFKLCPTHAACDGTPLILAASTPYQLWLYAVDGAGQYTGTFTIAANEKPDGEQITMTVYSTSAWHKFWGVIAILAGVLLALYFTVFAKNRLTRDQLLVPVTALLATLRVLDSRLTSIAHGKPVNANGKVKQLRDDDLSFAALSAAGLPGIIPSPWPVPGTPLTTYAAYVKGATDWVLALTMVVSGMEKADAMYSPANAADVQKAIDDLDRLVTGQDAPDGTVLQQQVNAIVSGLHTTVTASGTARMAAPDPAAIPSPQQLQIEIGRLGVSAWLFTAVVTAITGSYILIFSQNGAGFGTAADYFLCLLWGFGLSSGAQLLQNGSPTSVSAAFGITR